MEGSRAHTVAVQDNGLVGPPVTKVDVSVYAGVVLAVVKLHDSSRDIWLERAGVERKVWQHVLGQVGFLWC
ncbi:MAG: hypothetical protein ABJA82_18890 [Myxococcales bacterium]